VNWFRHIPPGGGADAPIVLAVEAAVKSALRWKTFQIRLLGGVCAFLIAVSIALGVIAAQTYGLTHTVQQGAVTSCQAGNTVRAANVEIWDHVLGAFEAGVKDPAPAFTAWIASAESYITKTEVPQDCARIYHVSP
jgi:hypothetical protein